MIGELTFDKANKNVSLFLYSIVVISEFGNSGTMRRNFCENSFVEKMEEFTGISAYKDGKENRTLYNKSLYTQYYGFLDRFHDEDNKEYIRITPRGKQLLQYIEKNIGANSYENQYYIPEEFRSQVQELLWSSILFDPHGKHNSGAQRSKTDIDPPKVFIRILFDITKASNEELFYILFSLNKGDNGTLTISKTYKQLLTEVLKNRTENNINYREFFEAHGLSNKVNDSKVIDILSDPSFDVINKVDENGVVYNYLSHTFQRFSSQSPLLSITSSPLQYFIYGNDTESLNNWIQENILGRYGDHRHIARFYDTTSSTVNDVLSLARQANETASLDFYYIINAQSEDDFKILLDQYISLTDREENINLENFGYSKTTSAQQQNLIFPPNFHIIVSIPMSDSITTNSIFDGTFRRIKVEEEKPQENQSPSSSEDTTPKDNGITRIFFGAPGTGKSYKVKHEIIPSGVDYYTVTFYSDYYYSDFVGGIRPVCTDEGIGYKFQPGPFARALKDSFTKPVFLVIEEINRGNAAAIFGDIFQLLDRNNGTSEYSITNHDLYKYLIEEGVTDLPEVDKVYLPRNLNIVCTMNTADQNVFVLDSAFKRRFKMEYVPIDFNAYYKDGVLQEGCKGYIEKCDIFNIGSFEADWKKVIPAHMHEQITTKVKEAGRNWPTFAAYVNAKIDEINSSEQKISEDKKLGPFFIDIEELEDIKAFVDKVIYYLKQDVFKYEDNILDESYEVLYNKIVNGKYDLFQIFDSKK